ncbi:MAG: 30S ribosomal protein S16 [Gemmatimonadetes bacterium]|nr:30S ribosomal protein S16 [Gemmatimonadota bacterium]
MPVRIRLRRMGRKKQPHFRVVVADGTSPRDGRFVETIGYYKPLSDPARLVLDLQRVDHWLAEGASPSDTVRSLISKARRGGGQDVAVGEVAAEERQTKRAETLAAKRAAEHKAAAKKADKAASEPAAEAAADAGAQ